MAGGNGRSVPKKPTAPARVVAENEKEPDQPWRVQRIIEATDSQGRTVREREREMQRTIQRLEQEVERLKAQVDRQQRFDGKHAKIADHQMFQALLQSNLVLTEKVTQLIDQQHVQKEEEYMLQVSSEDENTRKERSRQRVAEVGRTLAFTERLLRATQVETEVCPCEEHRGIMFLEDKQVLVDNMCPKDWWFKQSNYHLYNNTLGAFTEANPFRDYLRSYNLQ